MYSTAYLDMLLVLGIVVLAIAFIAYQVREIGWLRQHGKLVTAAVTAVRHETGTTSTGFVRDNYYVTATWTSPQTGKTYTFWTWIINSCPGYMKGSLVPVRIDPGNPRRYTIEV